MDLSMSGHKNFTFGDMCIDLDWTWTKANESIVYLKMKSLLIGSILLLHVHVSAQIYGRSTSVSHPKAV